MLGVRGYVPPIRVYFLRTCVLSGFLSIFLICVFSGELFNLIVSCVPSGYTISRFFVRICFVCIVGPHVCHVMSRVCNAGPMFVTWVQYMNIMYFSPTVEIRKNSRELGCFLQKEGPLWWTRGGGGQCGGSSGPTKYTAKKCVCGGEGGCPSPPFTDAPVLPYQFSAHEENAVIWLANFTRCLCFFFFWKIIYKVP